LVGQAVSANISLTSTNESGNTSYLTAQPLRRRHGGDQTDSGAARPLVIEAVAPGRYILQAMPASPWYVASAWCGGVDLLREELVIAGGAAGCSIRVVLRNDTGFVHVNVKDADRATAIAPGAPNDEGIVVYILPEGDLVRQPIIGSGWNPSYQGYSVPPGQYLVLAMDHREELAYRDPEAMRKYAALGQEITVSPNGKADAEIDLIHGAP
jgi:hypothetical protein